MLIVDETEFGEIATQGKAANELHGDSLPQKAMRFDMELLPVVLRNYVRDVAHRADNASTALTAVSVIAAVGTVIGVKVGVRPKRYDSRAIYPNLWALMIARPSAKKSHLFDSAIKPITKKEKDAFNTFQMEMKAFNDEMEIYTLEKKQRDKQTAKGEKPTGDKEPPEKPTRKRYYIQDATVEKAAEIMNENENGVGVFVDEISGFIANMGKSGREGDKAFWLSAWNGKGTVNLDRIGRGSLFLQNITASILGTIQPDKLDMLLGGKGQSMGGDGFVQRFQLMVLEEEHNYKFVDVSPDKEARDAYYKLIADIIDESPHTYGATRDTFDEESLHYRFSLTGSQVFKQWLDVNQAKAEAEFAHNPMLSAHLAKYDRLFNGIALILFYVDRITGITIENTIHESYALQAVKWCEYLESHARVIYDLDRLKEERRDALNEKIFAKVRELEAERKLPMTYGEISRYVRGAKATDIKTTLRDNIIEKENKVTALK